jgi:hypothetical protein
MVGPSKRGFEAPMTGRQIADALIADEAPQATRKQATDLQAAILSARRKRNGGMVTRHLAELYGGGDMVLPFHDAS